MTTHSTGPAVASRMELPARLAALAPVRRRLADLLARFGWSDADAFRVLVCADEAIANAVTHCARPGGRVALRARVSAERAGLALANPAGADLAIHGRGKLPEDADEHGRGLILMHALSDAMRISLRGGSVAVALSFVPHPDET